MTVHCLGIDISWQPHNPSAVTELILSKESNTLTFHKSLIAKNHSELISFLRECENLREVIIAIDAPLTSQTKPYRDLDRQLLKVLAPYKVGLLPLTKVKITHLLRYLKSKGYKLYPIPYDTNRGVHEVYPQWISLGLTGGKLVYKKRRISSYLRKKGVTRYLDRITDILSQRFNLRKFDIIKDRLNGSSSWVSVGIMDSILCALTGVWIAGGLEIRTVPETPVQGDAFIIAPWLTDI